MNLGSSLMDLIKKKREDDFVDAGNPAFSAEASPDDFPSHEEHGFSIELKRKRRTQMMRQLLQNAGYGDLAKMIRIKED